MRRGGLLVRKGVKFSNFNSEIVLEVDNILHGGKLDLIKYKYQHVWKKSEHVSKSILFLKYTDLEECCEAVYVNVMS